jgi:hypothetical protein
MGVGQASTAGYRRTRTFSGHNVRRGAEMATGKGPWVPCTSSRLISSKWDRSWGAMTSERCEEWKELDLDDLEFVRSGGEPGAPPRAMFASCG